MCPFCRGENVLPVNNRQGKHWMYCNDCKASGPQKDTPEDAETAFATVRAPRRPGVIARLMGRTDDE